MRQLTAFIKKEFTEQKRNGRFLILEILFCMVGIMNPAIAKLTPWLMETMSGQLAESGMQITEVKVDALTSWTQYFKNFPILFIVFVVMFSGIMTSEYEKGTLINVITKGMKRWKILISKLFMMIATWTVGYLLTFGITYGYNEYFWDNSIAKNLFFAVFGHYLFGLWLISLIMLFSAIAKSASIVSLGVGVGFLIAFLLGFLPDFREFVPTFLLSSNDLLTENVDSSDCLSATVITAILTVANIFVSVPIFNKRIL